MTSVNKTIQFLMDELRNPDNGIAQLCDNQIFSGMPRIPSTLIAPHYTRIGIEYATDSGDNYFFTEFRDFDCLNIKIKITVSSAYGENENYCRSIMEKIKDLFTINRKKITSTYRIFVDAIQTNIIEENNECWIGTLNMDVRQFVLIANDMLTLEVIDTVNSPIPLSSIMLKTEYDSDVDGVINKTEGIRVLASVPVNLSEYEEGDMFMVNGIVYVVHNA